MKKSTLLLFILLGFTSCLLTFCNQEKRIGTNPNDAEKVLLSVPITRAGETVDEKRVSTARLIIVRSSGQPGAGEVLVNSNTPVTSGPNDEYQVFKEYIQVGYIDIYVFGNELPSWGLNSIAVGSTFSFSLLQTKTYDFTDHPVVDATHPIPSFAYHQNMHVDISGVLRKDGYPITLIEVQRLIAKVHVKINCLFSELPDNTPIALDSIFIRRMPKTSWLIPKYNTLTSDPNYFDGTYHAFPALTPSEESTGGFFREHIFYIPEYLVTDITKYTYITIAAHKVVAPLQRFHWKLVLGNGIPTKTMAEMFTIANNDDLTITRNVCYTYNIVRIIGFGDQEDRTIHLEADVSPWNWQVIPIQ